jgi:ATP synthase protein I
MSKLVLQGIRNKAYRLVIIPAYVDIALSFLLAIFAGLNASGSVLLGGVVWIIPNLYMVYRLFSNVSARAVQQIVRTFYRAEIIKLLLSAALFIGMVKLLPLQLGPFSLGYIAAQITFWLTSLMTAMS